jgi:hypothetical protein
MIQIVRRLLDRDESPLPALASRPKSCDTLADSISRDDGGFIRLVARMGTQNEEKRFVASPFSRARPDGSRTSADQVD